VLPSQCWSLASATEDWREKRGAAELTEEAAAAATNPTATAVAPAVGWNISRGEEVLSSGVFMRGRKWRKNGSVVADAF
jgi:hypothetical protein